MFVEQLPSGRYRGGYRLPGGKKSTRTFDYRHEAEDWAAAEESAAWGTGPEAAPAPAPAAPVTPTVASRGAAWLGRKAGKAKSTRDGYATHLRAITASRLGAEPMGSVIRDDVLDWVGDMLDEGVGRPTINARLKVLRMIYRDALANLVVTHDPTVGVDFLATDIRPDRVLSDAEASALLLAAGDDLADMAALALRAGLRWQEVAGLPASAVIGDYLDVRQVMERSTGTIRHYTKSHQRRIVPMPDDLRDAMAARARTAGADDPDALMFTSAEGAPLDYYNWRRRVWRPALREAKLNPRPRFHDLRHTYGSTLAAAGVPRSEIAKLLGHEDEETTKRYIHAGDDGRRRDLVRDALAPRAPRLAVVAESA
jgi:integrase